MSKHSPGPFEADGLSIYYTQSNTSFRKKRIIAVAIDCEGGRENAKLFATAPEMLDSLRELIEVLEYNYDLRDLGIESQDKIARARLRIAKAKGES